MRRKLESAGYLVARYVYPAVGDEPVVCLDAAKM
jgi:hypothetical protein